MEEWKDIDGCVGYQISNLGRVRSVGMYLKNRWGVYFLKGRIRKHGIDSSGYECIRIAGKTFNIHRLVWDYFGNSNRNGIKLQVDHIDCNKLNNRIDNLQLLTARDNTTKSNKRGDKLPGAFLTNGRWFSRIRINQKPIYLGCFPTELQAHEAYMKVKTLNP